VLWRINSYIGEELSDWPPVLEPVIPPACTLPSSLPDSRKIFSLFSCTYFFFWAVACSAPPFALFSFDSVCVCVGVLCLCVCVGVVFVCVCVWVLCLCGLVLCVCVCLSQCGCECVCDCVSVISV
jgi:hypothetical protein